MRFVFLGFLIIFGGCAWEPLVQKIAVRKPVAAAKVAAAEKPPTLRTIRVRSCDCPDGYDARRLRQAKRLRQLVSAMPDNDDDDNARQELVRGSKLI